MYSSGVVIIAGHVGQSKQPPPPEKQKEGFGMGQSIDCEVLP